MQLTINTSDNFDIYDHMAELKAQGFMLLSFLLEQKENKIKFKTKNFAKKLGVHVSTLRRWIKKLIKLNFVTPDKRQRDLAPKEQSAGVKLKSMTENVMACNKNGNNDKEAEEIPDQVRDDKTQIRDDANGVPYTPLAMALLERFKPLASMAEKRCAAEVNKFSGLKNDYEELKLKSAVGNLKHLQSFR